MRSIGVVLAILGFGSAILNLSGANFSFRLLTLLEDYQPVAGFVIGLIGVALIALGMRSDKAKASAVVDPPYGRPDVTNPTVNDPQLPPGVQREDAHYVEDPQAMRNPNIDNHGTGPSTPGTFPPAGPPRE